MADKYERKPDESSGPNIDPAGDGARAELEQGSAQQASADIEQRFGRGVRTGLTPDTVQFYYYFAVPPPMAVDGRTRRALMRALGRTN